VDYDSIGGPPLYYPGTIHKYPPKGTPRVRPGPDVPDTWIRDIREGIESRASIGLVPDARPRADPIDPSPIPLISLLVIIAVIRAGIAWTTRR